MSNSVWILETTYITGIKEINGVYETREKALQGAEYLKKNSYRMGDEYKVDEQKITEFFVL